MSPWTPPDINKYDFMELVPDGWLREYLKVMQEAKNEMPLPFHFLAGACVIGNMIGLKAWATLSRGVRIYPNLNVLLLSPAGSCRRGEGTKIMEKVARNAGVNVLSGKVTPEGLLDELQERGDVLLYVEELSMLLTKQDFQRPIIPVLTKLLLHGDGKCEMRSRQMGERRAIPYVNLSTLFTSAPDWFMSTIPEEAFGGGLMSRFVVCCLNKRDVFNIDIQADDVAAEAMLAKVTRELVPLNRVLLGHIKGDNEAQAWIKEWYLHNETMDVAERLGPHRNRKPANLLRLALILAASAHETALTKRRLEQALMILDWLEPTLLLLYGMEDDRVPVGKGEMRVLHVLARHGGELQHAHLMRQVSSYFKGYSKEARLALEGMSEKGLISPIYKNGVRGWPPSAWRVELEVSGAREVQDGA